MLSLAHNATSADRLTVTGGLNLTGAVLNLTALAGQTINVSGTVCELASGSISGLTGAGPAYTYDFGSVNLNDVTSASFDLANLPGAFRDALGGSFSYSGNNQFVTPSGAISAITAAGFNNYNITFDTSAIGSFAGTLAFNGLSQQSGLSDASLGAMTIGITGMVIPEPSAALLGGFGLPALLRRRRA